MTTELQIAVSALSIAIIALIISLIQTGLTMFIWVSDKKDSRNHRKMYNAFLFASIVWIIAGIALTVCLFIKVYPFISFG